MDSLEVVRRTRRWRLWVRGTQTFFVGFVVLFAFGLGAAGRVPTAVFLPGVLVGMVLTVGGLVMFVLSIPLMVSERALFTERQDAVNRAFFRDLVRLRKPPPPNRPSPAPTGRGE
ncbi:hypothetical protein GCM10023322_43200 [Rugosimonospora acidiphila]|uniref:Uncharacterized protein n=1 Tax=Rugosimonospora acidiphila TaxID=556531 RepID=A0ABP9S2N5_9ACTN